MSSRKKKDTDDAAARQDLEKEIRQGRPFGLAEALGRAGGGNLKGASPVPLSRQVQLDVEALVESHLHDPEGSLTAVIIREVGRSPQFMAADPGSPVSLLADWIEQVLASAPRLEELVRQADVRWGRDYDERPLFNHPDRPDSPDDPYTPTSVRQALQDLLDQLD